MSEMKQGREDKSRIFGLDALRIICALLIYGRHSITMFGCTYGAKLDQKIIDTTSFVMTCFFILSGFSLYYVNRNRNIFGEGGHGLIRFYIKRMVSILPAYYLIHVIWLVFHKDLWADWIFLTPTELTGMQSAYQSLFGILHNGGTWFVSCIMICYFIYPLIQEILANISLKAKGILLGMTYLICVYSYFVVARFQLTGNYSNPFFRALEFGFGAILASILTENADWKKAVKEKWFLTVAVVLCAGMFFAWGYQRLGKAYFIQIIICMPLIAALIVCSWLIRSRRLENSRILLYCSSISYHFFLVQIFLWDLTKKIMEGFGLDGSRYKIRVSFVVCLAVAVLMYELFDKPVQKICKGMLKDKVNYINFHREG